MSRANTDDSSHVVLKTTLCEPDGQKRRSHPVSLILLSAGMRSDTRLGHGLDLLQAIATC